MRRIRWKCCKHVCSIFCICTLVKWYILFVYGLTIRYYYLFALLELQTDATEQISCLMNNVTERRVDVSVLRCLCVGWDAVEDVEFGIFSGIHDGHIRIRSDGSLGWIVGRNWREYLEFNLHDTKWYTCIHIGSQNVDWLHNEQTALHPVWHISCAIWFNLHATINIQIQCEVSLSDWFLNNQRILFNCLIDSTSKLKQTKSTLISARLCILSAPAGKNLDMNIKLPDGSPVRWNALTNILFLGNHKHTHIRSRYTHALELSIEHYQTRHTTRLTMWAQGADSNADADTDGNTATTAHGDADGHGHAFVPTRPTHATVRNRVKGLENNAASIAVLEIHSLKIGPLTTQSNDRGRTNYAASIAALAPQIHSLGIHSLARSWGVRVEHRC